MSRLAIGLVVGLAAGLALQLPAQTRVYRTTPTQDFRAVTHADWGDEYGPGSMVIDLDAAVERQSFRGLGGSFAEASCFVLMSLSDEKRAAAFEVQLSR